MEKQLKRNNFSYEMDLLVVAREHTDLGGRGVTDELGRHVLGET